MVTRRTVPSLRSIAFRRDLVLPQQKNRRAPRRSALTAAMAMPTMAPVLSPCGEVFAGADIDEDVDCAEEEGRTEVAGLPDGSGDSAGNGSPRRMLEQISTFSPLVRLTWVEHEGRVHCKCPLFVYALATVQVDAAHHPVRDATTRRGAVEENRLCVVDPEGPFWRAVEYFVNWVEACEESLFVGTSHLVGYARVAILSAHDAMVGWVKIELDNVSNSRLGGVRAYLMI
jgi:hypothetical protein